MGCIDKSVHTYTEEKLSSIYTKFLISSGWGVRSANEAMLLFLALVSEAFFFTRKKEFICYFSCFYIILIIFIFNRYITHYVGQTPPWPPNLLTPVQSSLGAVILTQQTSHVADTTKGHDATGGPCYTRDHLQLTTCSPN